MTKEKRARHGYSLVEVVSSLAVVALLAAAVSWTLGRVEQKVTVTSAQTVMLRLAQSMQGDALRDGGVRLSEASLAAALAAMDGDRWTLAGGGDGSPPTQPREISLYVRGDVAGMATLVDTSCVLVRVPVTAGVRSWVWDDIGGWCRGRTAVERNPDGPAPGYVAPESEPQWNAAAVTAPAAPQRVVATVAGSDVTVTWSRPAGAESFDVLRGTDAGTLSVVGNVEAATYTDRSLADGSYLYAVVARNSVGVSAASQPAAAAVGTIDSPVAPDSLTVTSVTATSITFTWDHAGADPDAFAVSLNGRGRFEVAGSARSATVRDVPSGTVTIGLRARVGAAYSQENTVQASASGAPQAPTNVRWKVDGQTVLLSWDAPGPAGTTIDGYRIYVDGSERTTSTGTSVSLAGLVSGTGYRVEVVAYGPGGTGAASATVIVTAP